MTRKVEVMAEDEWDDRAYLRYLPPHLQERYRESVSDPELLHLGRQVALIDVRIKSLLLALDHQVLAREEVAAEMRAAMPHASLVDVEKATDIAISLLPEGFINHRTFKRLETLLDRMEKAQLDGRIREADRSKKQLEEAIRGGKRDGDVWEDIENAMEQRRRLVEAEQKRLAQMNAYMSLDQVVMLAGVIINVCKESVLKYVADREIQQYILQEADRAYATHIGLADNR